MRQICVSVQIRMDLAAHKIRMIYHVPQKTN